MKLPPVRKHAPKLAVALLLLTGLLSATAAIFEGLEPAAVSVRIHEERLAIGQTSQAPDLAGTYVPVFLLGAAAAAASFAGAIRSLEHPGDLVAYGGAFLGLLVFPLVTPFAALALAFVALASEEEAPDPAVLRWFPAAAGLLLLLTAVAAIARAYNQTQSALALVPPFDQAWAVTATSLAGLGGAVIGASKALGGRDLRTAAAGSLVALLAYPIGTVPALGALVLLVAALRGRPDAEDVPDRAGQAAGADALDPDTAAEASGDGEAAA